MTSDSDSDDDVVWVPSKPTTYTSRVSKVKGKASTSKVKGKGFHFKGKHGKGKGFHFKNMWHTCS